MFHIGSYLVTEKLFESAGTIIYRGQNQFLGKNGIPEKVIIKHLKYTYPTSEQLARFRREFELTKRLGSKGVVNAYELIRHENSLAMVLEDIDGDSVASTYKGKAMRLPEFWRFALKVVDCLALVHDEKVIHKDINPSNILINKKNQRIKLIDFGISIELASENVDAEKPGVLKGTLAYISPEQTGRMNRVLDYRSDFYSLGVTFYQMLTGTLPFSAEDPMEWVHAHIARMPPPPNEVNNRVPAPLSDMVMKLMAKNAEDRYITVAGLRRDLEVCRREFSTAGSIGHFTLGANDRSGDFTLSQKIYGRELEIATMLGLYEKVVAGNKALLSVAGVSGIGKTSLIREIQKPVVSKQGYYTEGKFDQFERSTPYSAIVQSLTSLVQQILTESQNDIDNWKKRLIIALEGNGQLVLDVIPELEHIIGPQKQLPNIQGTELKNRFHRTFQRFVRTVCDTERPLVIFLDDMQWCDLATLKLVTNLVQDSHVKHLYLVLAYRDNEVSETHPFAQTLVELQKSSLVKSNLKLSPLSAQDMTRFIADSMNLDAANCRPLAALCHDKTLGNPFYFNQFLLSLYEAGHIRFSHERLQWTWDLSSLLKADSTDNVIDLMLRKMAGLPLQTQHLMQRAACIGNRFDLITLATISKSPIQEVAQQLLEALKIGFLLPVDESYQWAQYLDKIEYSRTLGNELTSKPEYRFLHDRVQQAAYTNMSQQARQRLHLQIGRILRKELTSDEVNHRIFEIVGHFNLTDGQFEDDNERLDVVRLNCLAGQKARGSAAFNPAEDYFTHAINLINVEDWQNNVALLSDIYLKAADMCCINTSYRKMHSMLATLNSHCDDVFVKLSASKINIQARVAQNQSSKAVDEGLQALKIFNVDLPRHPEAQDVQQIIAETMAMLDGVSEDALLNAPRVTENEKRIALELLNVFASAAFQNEPALFALLVCKMVQLTRQHGNTNSAPFAYTTYGIILSGLVEDTPKANFYASVGLKLVKTLGAADVEAKAVYVANTFVEHWQHPLLNTVNSLRENYQLGLTRGDYEYACMSAMIEKVHSFYLGRNLRELQGSIGAYLDMMRETGQEIFYSYTSMLAEIVAKLQVSDVNPLQLSGQSYNEETMLEQHEASHDHTALAMLFSYKQQLAFWSGDVAAAKAHTGYLFNVLPGVVASIYVPEAYFYQSLITSFEHSKGSCTETDLTTLKTNLTKYQDWRRNAPENYEGKALLLEAELARLTSSFSMATINLYEQAIHHARHQGFVQEEAIGNELFALFWTQHNKREIAQIYLKKAFHLYDLWGCELRKCYLSTHFSPLLTFESTVQTWEKTPTAGTSSFTQNQELDFSSVMKASQAISREIVREDLIKTMMLLVLENAGAQNGTLLLLQNQTWQLTATVNMENKSVQLLEEAFDFVIDARLPIQLLQYVQRTREVLAIQCATEDPVYSQDPYIVANQSQSIIGLPILHRGEVSGLIYLENNLLKNAFTPDRVEIIQLLASQLVISMDNASLYAQLEQRVEERTKKLHEANEKLTLLATTDSLTGAFNRRHFIERANVEFAKSRRSKRPVSIMMLDIDHFKKVNDGYGHAAGDEALKKVVKACMDTLRPGDIFGRLGGEEFAILLPETDLSTAKSVAERVRTLIKETIIHSPPHHFSVTVSIGISMYEGSTQSLENMMNVADQGLYKAKNAGRNQVVIIA